MQEKLSFFKRNFWDLFFMKLLRNLASVKYQWLLLLYFPIIWGMFNLKPDSKDPWISAALGLSFLGGGFISLATSRIIAKTKLIEPPEEGTLDTDR